MRGEEFIRRVMTILAIKYPLVYSRIAPFDIVLVDGGIFDVVPAATDGSRIFLSKRLVDGLAELGDADTLVTILAHEALHNLFGHPSRMRLLAERGYPENILNIAADAKVDQYLRELLGRRNDSIAGRVGSILGVPFKPVTLEMVAEMLAARGVENPAEFVKRRSMEEIVEKLVPRSPRQATMPGAGSQGGRESREKEQTGGGREGGERRADSQGGSEAGGMQRRGDGSQGGAEEARQRDVKRQGGGGHREDVDSRRQKSGGGKSGSESQSRGAQGGCKSSDVSKSGRQGSPGGGGGGSAGEPRREGVGSEAGAGGELLDIEEGDRLERSGVKVWRGRASERVREKLREAREALDKGDVAEAVRRIAEALQEAAREARAIEEAARSIKEAAEKERERIERSEKEAGVGKGMLQRALDELEEGYIDWRRFLRRRIEEVVGTRRVRRSWARLNKKLPNVRPGITPVGGIREVAAAIDISGSISDWEYEEFASAVLDAVREARPRETLIAWWDYGVRRVERVRGRSSLERVKRELLKGAPGGGGTSIAETLKLMEREARKPGEKLLIIASDFYTDEPQELVAEGVAKIARENRRTIVALIVPPKGRTPPVQEGDNIRVIRLPPREPWRRTPI